MNSVKTLKVVHITILLKKKKKDGRRKWVKVQRKEKLKKYPWITLDIV